MFDNLKYDLNRIMENDPAARSKIEFFLVYPSVHALIAYRIAHFLYNKKIYNVIREIGVMDKILFGSDYPLLPIERYEASLNELSEEEKSKIMGDNALKLLKKCSAL